MFTGFAILASEPEVDLEAIRARLQGRRCEVLSLAAECRVDVRVAPLVGQILDIGTERPVAISDIAIEVENAAAIELDGRRIAFELGQPIILPAEPAAYPAFPLAAHGEEEVRRRGSGKLRDV